MRIQFHTQQFHKCSQMNNFICSVHKRWSLEDCFIRLNFSSDESQYSVLEDCYTKLKYILGIFAWLQINLSLLNVIILRIQMGTIGTDLTEFELENSVLTWRNHVGPESSKINQIEKGFFNYTLYEKCNLMRLSKITNVLKSSDKVQLQLSLTIC